MTSTNMPTSLPGAAVTLADAAELECREKEVPCLDDLGRAVACFIQEGSETDRTQIRHLATLLEEQGLGPADCLAATWETAQPVLLSAGDESRPRYLQRVIDAQIEIWGLFDRAYQIERRAHRQMAEAITRKNVEVDRLLDSIPALAFTKDADLRYTAVNQAFCDAFELPREHILSLTDEDLFPAEMAQQLVEHDHKVLEKKIVSRQETTCTLHGEQRTLLITKAPLLDLDHRLEGLVGISFDITARKRLEQKRLELAAAVESAHDAILVVDTAGTIRYINPAFERLTQFSREEAVGQNARIFHCDEMDLSATEQMRSLFGGGEGWSGVVKSQRKDGSLFDSEQTIAPVHNDEGRLTGYVSIIRDVSEQKKMLAAWEHAVMVKSDFTSMMSHELRTPLCAIKEAVGVLADGTAGPTNDHQTQFLGLAQRNVDRLHRLINDVLDFSRMERGGLRTNIAPHHLNEMVSQISSQHHLAAQKRGIELTIDLDPGIGSVSFDAKRIRQVLVNLLSNATRYCDGPWIRVSTLKRAGEVVVTVRDSGPGIAPEHLHKIFSPFVQLSSGLGRQAGGTGLGLAISRQIIELHGGRIWAESSLGKGSAFQFALPLGPKENNGANDQNSSS